MKTSRTIEVVGGGLAGLSLGLALRRADVPVTIFETGTYPRHRVCGEFITGLSPATISRLGLRALLHDALPHREVAWFLRSGKPHVQRLPEPALGLSRFALDARLANAFGAAGGELRAGERCTALNDAPGRVFATGRRRSPSDWIGLKFHVHGLVPHRDLELHLGDDAYVGLSRVEAGAINVCGLFHRRPVLGKGPPLLLAYLRECGLSGLACRLEVTEIDAASFSAVAALGFNRSVSITSERVELGDAAAMIPPFTGNGMAMAFQSAETALGPLRRYAAGEASWADTRMTIAAALRRRFRVRLASAQALHPFLLRPRHQRWLFALGRGRLIPFGPLYASLH